MEAKSEKNRNLISRLGEAVRTLHLVERYAHAGFVEVQEDHLGRPAWVGRVEIFDLHGHPSAMTCFAWEEPPGEEARGPRLFAVLQAGPVKTAADAVRASIVQRSRETQG